jgi:tRNA dimethylallyltransferase
MLPILVIAGPTAVGKTEFAIGLALQLNTEIISADSMQVYQYMDIGTAKPSLTEQAAAPHHLIDIVPPDREFSVADYQQRFNDKIVEFNRRHKLPLVVGGTGLYIRACVQSYALDNPANADSGLRRRLAEQAAREGNAVLFRQLAGVDPEAAARIHPNDQRRIIRALEVYLTTGTPISQLQKKNPTRFPTVYILLERERAELYRRIENRVDRMMAGGLEEEVVSLVKRGYGYDLKAMQSLGYKQVGDYLQNRCTREAAVAAIKQKTRNYAKRQLTWFHRESLDLSVDLTGKNEQFYREIFKSIEGRLRQMSNR